jgi:RNA polymerase sigma factor (sigma-70 family)
VEASALQAPQGPGRLAARGPLLRLRTDDQLVALFRRGHDEAFQVIFDRHRPQLFAYARQMLGGSRSDAEDVLQDVFLRAYRALRTDERPVTLRAWLYRVAHNRCVDHLRRPAPPPADVLALSRTPPHDPLAEAERREHLRHLVADVRRLPAPQRSALLMRELEGLSYEELSVALEVSVPAVKSLLVRARVGLLAAGDARDTACAEIRGDLLAAHDRHVRCDARARRHLRDCDGCRSYHQALRVARRGAAGLLPGPGPLGALAKLLGLGGAGSGAAAGGGALAGGGGVVAGGAGVVAGGAVAGTASKVAAALCCAAVLGGGAAEVRHQAAPASHPGAAARGGARSAGAPSAAATLPRFPADTSGRATTAADRPTAGAVRVSPAREIAVAGPVLAGEPVPGVASPGPDAAGAPHAAGQTGGVAAPADDAPASGAGTATPAPVEMPRPSAGGSDDTGDASPHAGGDPAPGPAAPPQDGASGDDGARPEPIAIAAGASSGGGG